MVLIQLILYYFLMTLFRETRLLKNKLNIDRSTLDFISITVECFLHKVLIYKFFSRYSVLLKVTLLSLSQYFLSASQIYLCVYCMYEEKHALMYLWRLGNNDTPLQPLPLLQLLNSDYPAYTCLFCSLWAILLTPQVYINEYSMTIKAHPLIEIS